MPLSKTAIRKYVLDKRNTLASDAVEEKSRRITQGLTLLHSFSEAGLVMCYMDFRNEARTSGILDYCFSHNKRAAIPCSVVMPSGEPGLMVYEIRDIGSDICTGKYGILEPDANRARPVLPLDIDFVLVPGVAFDTGRHRIGYGAGYYDRFLRTLRPDCFKAGLAFELQIVNEIPVEDYDIRVDAVVTESRIIF